MSRTPRLTDAVLRAALMPAPEVAAPPSLLASISADIRRSPQQRSRVGLLPWAAARFPMPWPAARGLVPILLTAALVLAAVAGASVGAQIVRDGLLPQVLLGPEGVIVPPTPTPSPTPSPMSPEIGVVRDLAYESADPLVAARALDVYAPTALGSWPVVVMFHGGIGVLTKDFLEDWARDVAAEGYVVFVPGWGLSGPAAQELPRSAVLSAIHRQAACAVAYARSHAAEYGGDPSKVILFGHAQGANAAAILAFNRPAPSEGCPGGEELGPVSSIVTFEGDWLLMDQQYDRMIPDDPAVLSAGTPWDGLAGGTDVPVVMLVSEGSGGVTEPPPGDPPVDYATARDLVALRTAFLDQGADGQRVDAAQEQALFHAALEANGNPVSLTEIPGADFNHIGASGRPTLLAAFEEAAGR